MLKRNQTQDGNRRKWCRFCKKEKEKMQEPLTITPTSAPWLESCGKRFHTHVTRQFPGTKTSSPVLRFGNMVHAVLRGLYDPQKPGPLPHIDDLERILHFAAVRGGYATDADRAFDVEKARTLLHVYLKQTDITDDECTIAVESGGVYPIKVKGQELYTLSARLDRVLKMPDGTMAGIDYKTGAGSKLPPISGVLVNLASLKAAYPGAPAYEFWLENLGDEGVERVVYKGSDFKGAVKGLTAQVRMYLGRDEHPGSRNDGCIWCPLRPTCAEAEIAGVEEEDLEF